MPPEYLRQWQSQPESPWKMCNRDVRANQQLVVYAALLICRLRAKIHIMCNLSGVTGARSDSQSHVCMGTTIENLYVSQHDSKQVFPLAPFMQVGRLCGMFALSLGSISSSWGMWSPRKRQTVPLHLDCLHRLK